MSYNENSLKHEWIQNPEGLPKESIVWAKQFGLFLANPDKNQKELSTSQIRRFFGQLKRLQAQGYSESNRSDLLMLGPQLAYAVGRDRKKVKRKIVDASKIHYFYKEITTALDAIEAEDIETEKQYFKNFVNLVEAIVAYHRFESAE